MKCFVVQHSVQKEQLQRLLGDDWKVLYIGECVPSCFFSQVVISEAIILLIKQQEADATKKEWGWIDHLMTKCRTPPLYI